MKRLCTILIAVVVLSSGIAWAQGSTTVDATAAPDSAFWRVLTLRDYNTRVVVLGVTMLGIAAGTIGSFMLLRKRALLGDALAHATLPGIAIAFMVMVAAGGTGKWLPGLLMGAVISGLAGVGMILLIQGLTRLKEDTALGIVLSMFFGLGVALMGIVQRMSAGSAAGLETFIYGKTAAMLASDAKLIACTAVVVSVICLLLFKELRLLSFDPAFARAQGWPTLGLDLLMMAMVTGVTVVGLQAVGLILIIALLIIPAAAARFWTHRLRTMLLLSAVLGGVSGWIGASISALVPRMPAGAIIVLVAAAGFVVSMFAGPARGVLARWIRLQQLNRLVARQHLLRAAYELIETGHAPTGPSGRPRIRIADLMAMRSWSRWSLMRLIHRLDRQELITLLPGEVIELTDAGMIEARRVVRDHRLWELYLITHAEVAPSHVDRGADMIEHVLGNEMVAKLERLLEQERQEQIPQTPHVIR